MFDRVEEVERKEKKKCREATTSDCFLLHKAPLQDLFRVLCKIVDSKERDLTSCDQTEHKSATAETVSNAQKADERSKQKLIFLCLARKKKRAK